MGHLARLEARIPIGDSILKFEFFQVGISGSQTRGGSDSVGNRWARWQVERTSDEGEEKWV